MTSVGGGTRFRILGALELRCGGAVVPISQGMSRNLLACLLLRADQPVPARSLVTWLWDASPPRDARTALRGHVMRLRRLLDTVGLGDRLERSDLGYRLRVRDGELDLHDFRGLVRRARYATDASDAAELWARALDLWRGEPLSNVTAERLVRDVVPLLTEERSEALESRIDADLLTGRHTAVIGELRELLREFPMRERFWGQLMRAQALAGRQAEALATFRNVHTLIRDELGIEPSAEIRSIQRGILSGLPAVLRVPRASASR